MNLATALKIIESGEIFSCKVVSFDAARKKGGEIKSYSQLMTSKGDPIEIKPTKSVAQNHFNNSTRNCSVCADGQPTSMVRKIHIFLLLEVNGQKVML
jgi:hypothetical protein